MLKRGFKKGLPIALGYFPVAFSFGVLCVNSHMPLGMATLISITNFTSSGQFAGLNLMVAQATYLEVAITLLMINARYFLMSLTLSQKIDQKMTTLERMLVSFCISDETFAIASLEKEPLTFKWLAGFMLGPFIGWTLGAASGELIVNLLPLAIREAMGIALYGMFLAIIIPASRESRPIALAVGSAAVIHILLNVIPLFAKLGTGFKLIIATLVSCLLIAKLFPREEDEYE